MSKGITSKEENYSDWFVDLVLKAKLADYSPVRGCMVIRPNGYAIWENIQKGLDERFKRTGHVNAYFPMLIPESFLLKEAEHVEGFAPECATVTRVGKDELTEHFVLRPTSETIIWSMYKKWIQSWRDLPILMNQWANVIRWEMRTRLFLRTTEFLWQEGHTAHATHKESVEEALKMLEVYRDFAENEMAMPVLTGKKTEKEKFPGAVTTYCIEAMMQDKRALQAGTSHDLGQNFARAFDVKYLTEEGNQEYVWATSWGVSTRLIGGLIMTHSDDKGLVLPPKLAPLPVIIIPIYKSDEEKNKVFSFIEAFTKNWDKLWFKVDDRDQYRPGFKFAEAELMGIPIRLEVGPKDAISNSVIMVSRDNRDKKQVPVDNLKATIDEELIFMQKRLFDKALKFREDNTKDIDNYEEFKKANDEGGFFRIQLCGNRECEMKLQEETKATIRVITFDKPDEKGRCLICNEPVNNPRIIAAKAY